MKEFKQELMKYLHVIEEKNENEWKKIHKEMKVLEDPSISDDQAKKSIEKILKSHNNFNLLRVNLIEFREKYRELTKDSEQIEKEKQQRAKTFNGMTAREWTLHSRNVWNDISSPRKSYHKEHGAVFPYKLAERLIKMYSKENDLVLDPFSGVGTTISAAYTENRNAIGIELSDRFFNLTKKVLKKEEEFPKITESIVLKDDETSFEISNGNNNLFNLGEEYKLKLVKDDCRNMKAYLEEESVQLIVTSPPYADFIHKSIEDRTKYHKQSLIKLENNSTVNPYSDSSRDLGNLEYDKFLLELTKIIESTYDLLKPGGYAAWVVKDYKDKSWFTSYLDFHTDVAKIGIKAGFLYHDLIVWDQNEQRSLMLLGYPSKFHTNQNCSFIVILRKPNEKEEKKIKRVKEQRND